MNQKKNEYMTVRDPDEVIRLAIDRLRVAMGIRDGGIQPTRTEVIRRLVDEELARLGPTITKT